MTVTLRSTKGSALTHSEGDANFSGLANATEISVSGATYSNLSAYLNLRVKGLRASYGAVGDGVADDSAAMTAALGSGKIIEMEPYSYMFSSQVIATIPAASQLEIYGYGSEILTTGAISGLRIFSGNSSGRAAFRGLRVNHRGNANATHGFDMMQSWHALLYDCFVEAHGVSASYAAFHIGNSDVADNDTGSFWTRLVNCGCRKRSSTDVGDITHGVLLEGSSNATNIINCDFSTVTTGVKIKAHSGQTYIANGVVIDGTAFELFTTAIHAEQSGAVAINGLKVTNNRVENGTTFMSLTGTATQPVTPAYLSGNFLIGGGATIAYLNNPNSQYIEILDAEVGAGGVTPQIVSQDGMLIRSTSGSVYPLTVRTQGGGRGIDLKNSSNSSTAFLVWTGTGTQARLRSNATNELALSGVKGISNAAATDANNLRGTVTFATAATATVTFATAETDATYFIVLGSDTNETFWWSAKGTGGFTINSSNAASTAVVNWVLIR